MSYPDVDIIWESEDGNERIVLAYDEGPSIPYDDGSTPILQIVWRNYCDSVEQVTDRTSYVVDDNIVQAAARLLTRVSEGREVFERYLRIFHGTTSVVWYGLNRATDYLYVTFDTADWRERVGLTDGYIKAHFDRPVANMDEWVAYCDGEVYWARLEEKARWHREGSADVMETWETVDSIGGFYGYEWAVEGAKEHLLPVASSATV